MEPLFIFDIDGVLTHPHVKKPNPTIIAFIAEQLSQKKPVALATGRAIRWIEKEIIPLLQKKLTNNDIDNLFISGEKGGVWMEFKNGKAKSHINKTIHFPKEVVDKVRDHVSNMQGIFFDSDKYTMVSVEINGGKDTEEIKKQKQSLAELEKWLKKEILPKYQNLELDPSEISVDILVKGINKSLAAKEFLDFLHKKHISAESFLMFGDSPSDTLICEALHKHGKKVTFLYVGKEPLQQYDFPVVFPPHGELYDKGVAKLLKQYT